MNWTACVGAQALAVLQQAAGCSHALTTTTPAAYPAPPLLPLLHPGSSEQEARYRFEPCDGPRPRETAAEQGEEAIAGSSDDDDEGLEEDFAFLRRMRGEADGGGGACDTAAASSSSDKGGRHADKRHAAGPLQWFGVLVPPALKESQASFRQGERQQTHGGHAQPPHPRSTLDGTKLPMLCPTCAHAALETIIKLANAAEQLRLAGSGDGSVEQDDK